LAPDLGVLEAGDQQVIQLNGQIHQLVKGDGGIPAGQLPTDILAQAASVVVDEGPVVPTCSGGQGPKFQGEFLGAPLPLPQVEETSTRRSTFGRMVEDGPEAAGELPEVVQRRISFSPHSVCTLQSSP
jgi:hypothetical protein